MSPHAILFPAIAMFLLTLAQLVRLGLARYRAIRAGAVDIKYYRAFSEGSQPDELQLLSRHVQNHFEIPPLFHVAVLFLYAGDAVSLPAVVLAWLFFLARCVHGWIHLGRNDVTARFAVFGASLLFLLGLWLLVLAAALRT